MPEKRIANYEAMFLLSQAQAADFGGAVSHIRTQIERYQGTIIAMKKWDERRLSFEINKQKRGVYILAYFAAPTSSLAEIERAFNLSENVTRTLIQRADHYTVDEMKASDDQKGLEMEAKLRATQPALAAAPIDIPAVEEDIDADDDL